MKRHLSVVTTFALILVGGASLHAETPLFPLSDPPALQNPSFETVTNGRPDGWETSNTADFQPDAAVAHSGSGSVKIANAKGNAAWWSVPYAIPAPKAGSYPLLTFRAWVKRSSPKDNVFLEVFWFRDGRFYRTGAGQPLQAVGEWAQVSVTDFAPAPATFFRLALRSTDSPGPVWFDDVSVEAAYQTPAQLTAALNADGMTDPEKIDVCATLMRDGKLDPKEIAQVPPALLKRMFDATGQLSLPDATIRLGNVLIDALQTTPDDMGDIPLLVATAYAMKGDAANAYALARKAATWGNNVPVRAARLLLAGQCAAAMDRPAEAATLFQQVDALDTTAHHKLLALYGQAKLLRQAKDEAGAKKVLQDILRRFPESSDPWQMKQIREELGAMQGTDSGPAGR